MRSRDVGFAFVNYDNGLALGALSLNETLLVLRERSSTLANGLLSVFNDGRWSAQGTLSGSKLSPLMRAAPLFSPLFRSLQGEVALTANSSAQAGFMPTAQVAGESRLHLLGEHHEFRATATLARTFDGLGWRTTVLGEARGWLRRGSTTYSLATIPQQLAYGDALADWTSSVSWERGRTTWEITSGVRFGEARRGTTAWGTLNSVFPLREDVMAVVSIGSYPVDLLQSLPGGRYVAISLRLPENGSIFRRRVPPSPEPPARPDLPMDAGMALVIGVALDSANLREVRVWAPAVERVELLADFTEWIPAPLIRQPNGEWRGYYRASRGRHLINLRINGERIEVPSNLVRVDDDFNGTVGVVIVR